LATATAPTLWSGDDPVPVYKFWVEIDSIVVAEFQECSGLNLERDVQEILEGGLNERVQYLPGHAKGSNVVLKHGVLYSRELWDWYQTGLYDGQVRRVNFSVLLHDLNNEVAQRWDFLRGFPVKWEGPQFNVESNQVAVSTLEIAHSLGAGGGEGGGGEGETEEAEDKEEKKQALATRVFKNLRRDMVREAERVGRW
jgi:phage tail-like protein